MDLFTIINCTLLAINIGFTIHNHQLLSKCNKLNNESRHLQNEAMVWARVGSKNKE